MNITALLNEIHHTKWTVNYLIFFYEAIEFYVGDYLFQISFSTNMF
jgi:hypothetical protein